MSCKYSYGNPTIHSYPGSGKIITGNFVSIAVGVNIFLGNNHRTDWVSAYPFGAIHENVFNSFNCAYHGHPATKGDIIIGNDVWDRFFCNNNVRSNYWYRD